MLYEFASATWQTLYMVCIAGLLATLFGLPLGMLLLVTRSGHICQSKLINCSLSGLVNAIRSVPFIILLVALIPLTRFLVGTAIGTTAAIIPLSVAAVVFFARVTESALGEVDAGLVEAGHALGAKPRQIMFNILLPEAMPALIKGMTLTFINLIAYSAMAGTIGGGGLGDLAIRYGYQRFDTQVMLATIVVLIFLVQLLQWLGDYAAKKMAHR